MIERRAWVRFPCGMETSCQPLASAVGQQWSGHVRDLSAGGVGVVLNRRFELGTLLTIEVLSNSDKPSRTFLGRVIHVHSQPDGSWHMGCRLANSLSEDDVQALLD